MIDTLNKQMTHHRAVHCHVAYVQYAVLSVLTCRLIGCRGMDQYIAAHYRLDSAASEPLFRTAAHCTTNRNAKAHRYTRDEMHNVSLNAFVSVSDPELVQIEK